MTYARAQRRSSSISESAERTRLFANVDLAVNAIEFGTPPGSLRSLSRTHEIAVTVDRDLYDEIDASDVMGKKAIMGALTLYLDFINLFIMLLQLFGNQRE